MVKIQTANCGHTMAAHRIVSDWYGYSWCVFCSMDDSEAALLACNRLSAKLKGETSIYTVCGIKLGVVSERVTNNGARTPTHGKYSSDRMTVLTYDGSTWYANAPKAGSGNLIVLRRA